VADSVRIGSERLAWHSQRRRPWLRLVRTDLEDLGPVSPELVLVDPPLAAAVRLTPDAVVVQNGHVGAGVQLTRPAALELPEVGHVYNVNEEFGTVESVKAVSELFTPVAGEVVEVNKSAVGEPGIINDDPFGDGWLIRLKLSSDAEGESLMTAEAYETYVREEEQGA